MKLFSYLYFLVFLLSCNHNVTIENRIYEDLKKGKKKEIDIKNYVDFQWDKAYLFQRPISNNEINKILGLKYDQYKEFSRPFIFIKNDKIIYSENLPTDVEKISNGQLIYKDLLNEEEFLKIDYNNSKLKAKIEKEGELEFVVLE